MSSDQSQTPEHGAPNEAAPAFYVPPQPPASQEPHPGEHGAPAHDGGFQPDATLPFPPADASRNGSSLYEPPPILDPSPSRPAGATAGYDDPMEPGRPQSPTYHGYPDSYRELDAATETLDAPSTVGPIDHEVEPYSGLVEEEEQAPAQRRRSSSHLLREILETVVLAAIIFLAVRAVVQNFKVEGSSMVPSFVDGEYMLVNRAVYTRIDIRTVHKFLPFISAGKHPEHYILHGPQHGDVIVFHPPATAGGDKRDFIKRVIGVPGDTVDFKDSHVVVNGRELAEPYISAPTMCQGQFCHVVLGEDQFFVMGDNRTNSSDSRFWGPVAADKIIGKALLIYWCGGPQCKGHTDHIGFAPNHQPATAKPAQ